MNNIDIGLIFAIITAISFAVSNVLVRKGSFISGESFTSSFLSVFIGVLLFLGIIVILGEWRTIFSFSFEAYLLVSLAGIIHFVIGRLLAYRCFRLIGANKGNAILRTQIFYPVILGVLFLEESLTVYLMLGVLLIAIGVSMVSSNKEVSFKGEKHFQGIVAGIAGGFFWGLSGVLVKPALAEIGSPYTAVFLSYFAAAIIMAFFLVGKEQRQQLRRLPHAAIFPVSVGVTFTAAAQLFRYIALDFSPVSLVDPLANTRGLFVLLLSFYMTRDIEAFNWKVITGMITTVLGAVLLFL